MKKKFLSFILAVCLILPCAFMMTACGKGKASFANTTWTHLYEIDKENDYSVYTQNYSTSVTTGTAEECLQYLLDENLIDWTEFNEGTPVTSLEELKTLCISKLPDYQDIAILSEDLKKMQYGDTRSYDLVPTTYADHYVCFNIYKLNSEHNDENLVGTINIANNPCIIEKDGTINTNGETLKISISTDLLSLGDYFSVPLIEGYENFGISFRIYWTKI